MKKERAQELRNLASQWPYWGNLSRFMTTDELAEVERLWTEASCVNGNLSRASIVGRLARGVDPVKESDG